MNTMNNSSIQPNKSYVLNPEHDLHNSYTSENILLGIMGEKLINHFLTNHLKLKIKGNNLDVKIYPNENGFDISIPEIDFIGEVKNVSGKYYLDLNYIEDQLMDFCKSHARIKVIFISQNKFTKTARQFLRSCKVHVVEWGYQVKKDLSWNNALSRLHKSFYFIYSKYKDRFESVLRFSDKLLSNKDNSTNNTNLTNTKIDNYVNNEYNIKKNTDLNLQIKTIFKRDRMKKPPPPPRGWSKILGSR